MRIMSRHYRFCKALQLAIMYKAFIFLHRRQCLRFTNKRRFKKFLYKRYSLRYDPVAVKVLVSRDIAHFPSKPMKMLAMYKGE